MIHISFCICWLIFLYNLFYYFVLYFLLGINIFLNNSHSLTFYLQRSLFHLFMHTHMHKQNIHLQEYTPLVCFTCNLRNTNKNKKRLREAKQPTHGSSWELFLPSFLIQFLVKPPCKAVSCFWYNCFQLVCSTHWQPSFNQFLPISCEPELIQLALIVVSSDICFFTIITASYPSLLTL